jgi:hypothetical protein
VHVTVERGAPPLFEPGDGVADEVGSLFVVVRESLDGCLVVVKSTQRVDGTEKIDVYLLDESNARLDRRGVVSRETALRCWRRMPESVKEGLRAAIRGKLAERAENPGEMGEAS